MAGKYAQVTKTLPRLLGTEGVPGYQDRVNKVKEELLKDVPCQASALAAIYAALRGEKDKAEAALSAVNLSLEAVSQLLIDQFDIEDTQTIRLVDGQSISVQYEPYAQVKDKDAFREWCIGEGLLRQLQLPWQQTNSLTKERLLAGEPEPTGVEAYTKPKLVFRK